MKLLGYLFLILLVVAAVGYFRGWFSVSTVSAGSGSEVGVTLDKDKMSGDAKAAADQLGKLSAQALEAIKSLGRKLSSGETELAGTIESIDLPARKLMLDVGARTIEVHVPAAVPITRGSATVGLDQLKPDTRIKLVTKTAGEDQQLVRIELEQ